LATDFLVFQHQTDVNAGIFGNFQTELRVVEPTVIAFWLRVIGNLLEGNLLGFVA
jgi:hypothetical protein